MIVGVVRAQEGRIRLTVKGKRGRTVEVDAVIDTGYTGTLTLPAAVIDELGLRKESEDFAKLADGSVCSIKVYAGRLLWDGRLRPVPVDEMDTKPLVGMKLMKGHELKMHVRYGGRVTIRRLRKRT